LSNYAYSLEIDYILRHYDIPDEIVTDILNKLYDVLEVIEDNEKTLEIEGLKQKLGFCEVEKN